ncbi:DNA-binding protein [Myceligenerans xiligouense]|uniref:DNA-binding protein n=1 Tax=Myceligenerans xiligouense TaxID=253184 RepID=UPI000F513CDE|nr:DNA-binding protein [Myceligenerans xiligouense]
MSHPLPESLAAPAVRALKGQGIDTLEDLASRGLDAVEDLHGVGPSAISTLRTALRDAGLSS